MTIAQGHCEAILRRFSKRRDRDGDWIDVTFQLPPHDVPHVIQMAGLGTRWMLGFAEIGDDEQPVARGPSPNAEAGEHGEQSSASPPDKPKDERRAWSELPPSQQAGIACKDPVFVAWARNHYLGARVVEVDEWVRWICGVSSRAELDHNDQAAAEWQALHTKYLEESGRIAERR